MRLRSISLLFALCLSLTLATGSQALELRGFPGDPSFFSTIYPGRSAPALSATGQGRIYFDSASNTFQVSQNAGAYVSLVGAGGSAPANAEYWVGAAHAGLSAEKDLSVFTGLVLNTTGTPTAYAGTSCTNQFPRSLSASGAATCASVSLTADITGTLGVGSGGTGLTAGTSGGILGFTATGTLASSVALTANALVLGGGAGATPTPMASLGTTTTLLHGNAAGAPTFGAVVSADLSITTTTCTNQFVTALSAGAVGTCTTATLASAQFANQGTTTTILHGNAAGNPSFGTVSLTADVSGILPGANGGTGNGFFAVSGPTTSLKTFAFPDASSTVAVTSNNLSVFAATTSAQLAGVISDETGTGALVFATSPTLATPVLGVATATTVNKVTFTTPAVGSTLTIADGKTLTASNTLTFTGTDASSVALGAGGTVAYAANNLSVFAATTSAQLAGVLSDETGTGAAVFGTAPTFTTSITDPLVIGGTGTTSTLTLRSTSGVGAAGADIIFQTGNNGATEAMRILNNGNVGIGTTGPGAPLHIGSAPNSDADNIRAFYSSLADSASTGYRLGQSNTIDKSGFMGFTLGTAASSYTNSYLNFGITGRPTSLTIAGGGGNIGIGTTSFGTSAAGVLALGTATGPSTSPVDIVQLWAADIAGAGTFGLNVRDEGGNVYKIGNAELLIPGTFKSTATGALGWTIQNAANQACNTTCTTGACVVGLDTAAVGNFLACTDATADTCLCAG